MATPGWRARIARAATSPSSVWVGGIRMSTIAMSGGSASMAASSSLAVSGLGGDLEPGLAEQRGDPLADEQVVVRDHDPHGSSAQTVVPPPGGLTTRSVP